MARLTTTAQRTKDPETGESRVNQYTLQGVMGRGAFCKVKWALDDEGVGYAVKSFSRSILASKQVSLFDEGGACTVPLQTRIDTELRILREHPHPHVIGLVEVIDDPAHHKLYAVLEGMEGGQLMEWSDDRAAYRVPSTTPPEALQRWGGRVAREASADQQQQAGDLVYQEAVASCLLAQLLGAMAHLHALGVIHKDLKPDNLLLSMPTPAADPRFARPATALSAPPWPQEELRDIIRRSGFVAKVGDFNTAAVCPLPDCRIWDAEGTQQFAPPECFHPQHDSGVLGRPRDMWSLGCVLFAMLFGGCPFWEEEPIRLQLALIQFAMDPAAAVAVPGGIVSPLVEDLIRQLLHKDPAMRPQAAAALQHPWVK